MNKYLIGLLFTVLMIQVSSQGVITLSIDKIDISKKKAGDKIIVPLHLNNESGIKIMGFQFFVGFDHSLMSWDGTYENPLPGATNFNEKMPVESGDWLFNDNGNQVVVLWNERSLKGVEINGKHTIVELIFTYKGGLKAGEKSPLVWGETMKDVDGKLVLGKTEMYNEEIKSMDLKLVSGEVVN